MKKTALVMTAILVALTAGPATAGDYHTGTTLNCSECHVLHYSESHGRNPNGGGYNVAIGSAGPYDYLLRNEVNALCLTCHDGSFFAPDVLAANGGIARPTARLAGGLNRVSTSGQGYYLADGHTLGSTGAAPGSNGWTNDNGLDCIDCHTQHGRTVNGEQIYRNLNVFISETPTVPYMTYASVTNNLTKDVFQRSQLNPNHYDLNNVDYNEPDPTTSAYGKYCGQCHGDFHGSSASTNMRNQAGPAGTEWYRHPAADANIGAVGGGHSSISRAWGLRAYRVKAMSADGNWGTVGIPLGATATGDWTPTCITCHRAHGNRNAYGLVFASGDNQITEDGDGANYMTLCRQCHVQ